MSPRTAAARRRLLGGLGLGAGLLASGCVLPPPARDAASAGPLRTGRLALSVPQQPESSFSADFELRGRPEAGELSLLSPLGSVLGRLTWRPGEARLDAIGREPQTFASLDAMLQQATGTALPVAALFDWLDGIATPVPGWEPDLSGLPQGRLRARRLSPLPQAELRLVLER